MSADPWTDLEGSARDYVAAVDAMTDRVTTELLAVLAAFYAAAAALPPAEIDDDPGEPDVGIELRMAAERRLRVALGPLDDTLTVGWSPVGDAYEAFEMSLAYALAKTYDAALHVLAGQPRWDSRFDFWSNWGEHAGRAQVALYSFFESRGPLDGPPF